MDATITLPPEVVSRETLKIRAELAGGLPCYLCGSFIDRDGGWCACTPDPGPRNVSRFPTIQFQVAAAEALTDAMRPGVARCPDCGERLIPASGECPNGCWMYLAASGSDYAGDPTELAF